MRSAIFIFATFLCLCEISAQDYKVETYFVIDTDAVALYDGWGSSIDDLKQDFEYIFTLVNRRLATLQQYGLSIELVSVAGGPDFPKEEILGSPEGTKNKELLEEFDGWLERTYAQEVKGFDVAILLTGHSFNSKYYPGQSNGGTICSNATNGYTNAMPSMIVSVDGTSMMADVIARQLGIVLGANRDGTGSNKLMRTSTMEFDAENNYFSECSAFDLKEYFAAYDVSCILKTAPTSQKFDISTFKTIKLVNDPLEVCRRQYGEKASLCRTVRRSNGNIWNLIGDDACSLRYCRSRGYGCQKTMTPEEVVCDVGKVCRSGKCVDSASSAGKSTTKCLYGDVKEFQGFSCEEAVSEGFVSCDGTYSPCCNACEKNRRKRYAFDQAYSQNNSLNPNIEDEVVERERPRPMV